MRHLNIDIETYSEADISKVGVYRYVDDPTFEILLIAYSFDDDRELGLDEPNIVDLTEQENKDFIEERVKDYGMAIHSARLNCLPVDLERALTDPNVIKHAYNANFERTALAKYFGVEMPPEQWECTMIHAATLGLPGSLGKVGEVLGFEEDKAKDKEGKALIQYFCKPCKPTKTNGGRTRNLPEHAPEKWEKFKSYCQQDVVAEIAIADRLYKWKPTDDEHKLWCLDQYINDRGVRVDLPFVDGIVEFDIKHQEELLEEAREITGLQNPNSNSQIKTWLQDQGVEADSVNKDNVARLLKETDGDIKRALEIKQELGKTSTKKFITMQECICSDSRVHGMLQFYGANRTGRWAGRLVQVHNLPQNHIDDIELCREVIRERDFESAEMLWGQLPFIFSQLIRTAFIASDDRRFIVSDFSAIEARVLAWLAGEQWRLDVFNTHGKIYEASASQMFHIPIENIKKGSKLRQQGKIAELALGYGGGFGAIKAMDKDESIPDDEIPLLVANWRRANQSIVKFWGMVEAAAKTAINERRLVKTKWLKFSYEDNVLFIELPSGRRIAYWNAHIGTGPKGQANSILYGGVNQTTKQWVNDIETYGGKLTENIVQATARDCLAVAMMRVDEKGHEIVMHVHDEMIIDAPNDVTNQEITDIMSTPIEWAPGLPLKGDTYDTPFYKKD